MIRSYLIMPIILTRILYDKAYYYIYPMEKGNIYLNKDIYHKNEIINYKTTELRRIFINDSQINKYIYFLSNPSHIIDNIYLGSVYNSIDYEYLDKNDYGLIINLTTTSNPKYYNKFTYLHCPIEDNNNESIRPYLKPLYEYIMEYEKKPENRNKKILIHCVMGASRSASIVIYYLMNKYKDDYIYSTALNYVLQKRPIINLTYRFSQDLTDDNEVV